MPTDELADLLDEQEAQHSRPADAAQRALVSISDMGRGVPDFGQASLEERDALVEELEALESIEKAAKARRRMIEQGIVRAAAELEAKELRLGIGTVRIEPAATGYTTKDMSLRNGLVQLIPLGDLTRAEVDEAIPEIVSCKPDHRKLNALLKRGGRVQEAIESNRQRKPSDPLLAKVRIHRKGNK
jgi:hypothetical protein